MSGHTALEYLRDYVAIPSVNPMGREDMDAAIRGETRYAEHVRNQLAALRIDAELLGEGERKSVIAHIPSSPSVAADADTVLVASHLDTVPVDGMTIDPFDPVVKDARLYGRGSCDTKAGLAALIAALEHVMRRGTLRRNLIIVGESDEEAGSIGIADVIAHLEGRSPDWAIATEPTDMKLVTAHKGCATARVVTRGRACHGSNPDAGESAIGHLARAVIALEGEHARLREHADPRLGPATLSVGMAGGGHGVNVVASDAWLIVDRRLIPGEDADRVRGQLEAALEAEGLAGKAEVEACECTKAPLSTPDDDPGVQRAQAALSASGLDTTPELVAFGTDAGPLSVAGIPAVVLGPGHIEQAHTRDEWLPLDQLESMREFFVQLLG